MMRTFENKKHEHSFNVTYDAIQMLANSQGFYSRLKAHMEEQNWSPLFELTKDNYFDDALDFIMFIES